MTAGAASTAATPRRPGGFAAGVRCGFRGLGTCVTTPALWPWALVPALITAAVFASLYLFSHSSATTWARDTARELLGEGWAGAASWTAAVLVAGVMIVVLYLVFAPIARVVAAPFLAVLSDRTVGRIAGAAPQVPTRAPFVRFVVVPVRDALVFLALRIVAMAVLSPVLCFPGVGALVFFLALVPLEGLDRMDVAQSSRGVPLGRRVSFAWRRFGACCGLGIVAAALLLVPVANVLLLPGLVVGAALLDAEVSEDFPRLTAAAPAPPPAPGPAP